MFQYPVHNSPSLTAMLSKVKVNKIVLYSTYNLPA